MAKRMSQADATREVWRVVVTTLDGDLANGSDWIYAPERSLADIARVESAIKRVRAIAKKRSEPMIPRARGTAPTKGEHQ